MLILAVWFLFVSAAWGWPEEDRWEPVLQAGYELTDPRADEEGAEAAVDLVGEESSGVLYAYADDQALYFRLRLDSTAASTGDTLVPGAWGVLFETDGDPSNWEYSLATGEAGAELVLWYNAMDEGGGTADPGDEALLSVSEPLLSGDVRISEADTSTGGTADAWIELTLSRADLASLTTLSDTDPFQVTAATSEQTDSAVLDADVAGRDDATATSDLESALSDALYLDQDGDSLTPYQESASGTVDTDADTDDDGLSDAQELDLGTDPTLCDTDGDGLSDGLECGVSEPGTDTGSEEGGCFTADTDPSTTTDPLLEDTDGAGATDGEEDYDGDGQVGEWESDPQDPEDDADEDGDGIPDSVESKCGGSDTDDRDADGIDDETEGLDDTDGDSLPDFCDTDADGDGLEDSTEGADDTDGDGTPDYRDTDSDEDGLDDGEEGTGDSDCDGMPDFQDSQDADGPCADPDEDGRTNEDEAACGSDPSNADSDGDGILDGDDECAQAGPDTGLGFSGDTGSATGGGCGGCGVTPSPARGAGLLAVLLAVAALGRRRAPLVPALFLVLLPSPASAGTGGRADTLPLYPGVQRFQTLPDPASVSNGFFAQLRAGYALEPIPLSEDADSTTEPPPVSHLVSTPLAVGYETRPLRFGFSAPTYPLLVGDDPATPSWLGDLGLHAQALVLDRTLSPVGIGLEFRGTLPSGNPRAWVGDGQPTMRISTTLATGDRWVAATRFGYGTGSEEIYDSVHLGSRLQAGIGLSGPASDHTDFSLELAYSHIIAFNDTQEPADLLEAIAGGGVDLSPRLRLTFASGYGILPGPTAPRMRLLTGVQWRPDTGSGSRSPRGLTAARSDFDGDRLFDSEDLCPEQAEDANGNADEDGCPDANHTLIRFRVLDAWGRRIPGAWVGRKTGTTVERWPTRDGVHVHAWIRGAATFRVGAPGYETLQVSTNLANLSEEPSFELVFRLNALQEAAQVGDDWRAGSLRSHRRPPTGPLPPPDRDGDNISDAADLCPDQAEDTNDIDDKDGCPEGDLTVTRLVVHTSDGHPITEGRARLLNGPMPATWAVREGHALGSLLPGSYLLEVSAPGWMPTQLDIHVPQAHRWNAPEVVLSPPEPRTTLTLDVQQPGGSPLAARVVLDGPVDYERRTNGDGHLELGLDYGRYELRAHAPGFHHVREHLRVTDAHPLHRQFVLEPLEITPIGGVIPLPEALCFHRGSTRLQASSYDVGYALADVLSAHPEILLLSIEGHISPAYPQPDAWSYTLELARAAIDFLEEKAGIDPNRLVPVGLGDTFSARTRIRTEEPRDPWIEAFVAVNMLPWSPGGGATAPPGPDR